MKDHKARIKIGEEHRSISANLIDFLSLNDQAKKFGLGSFDLKIYLLVKISGKTEDYSTAARSGITFVA